MTVVALSTSALNGSSSGGVDVSDAPNDSAESAAPLWFRLTVFFFAVLQAILWWNGVLGEIGGRRAAAHLASDGGGRGGPNTSGEIVVAPRWIAVAAENNGESDVLNAAGPLAADDLGTTSSSAPLPVTAPEDAALTLCNISWAEVELDYVRVVAALRGESMLMIGDSVMRYQYINLAYYMTSGGKWRWDGEGPENEKEYQHGSWENFFVVTNKRILHEVCDCRRTEKHARKLQWDRVREGRYYNNTRNGVAFAFLLQLGDAGLILNRPRYLRSKCNPETGCTQHCPVGLCIQHTSEWHYPKASMEDLWIQQICVRQPTMVLLNMGRWTSLDHMSGVRRLQKTHAALQRCLRNPNSTTIFWWATLPQKSEAHIMLARAKSNSTSMVPPRQDHRYIAPWIRGMQKRSEARRNGPRWEFFDQFPLLWDVLRWQGERRYDLSMHGSNISTSRGRADPYWDDRHFVTPIVAALNRNLLLRMLGCSLRK